MNGGTYRILRLTQLTLVAMAILSAPAKGAVTIDANISKNQGTASATVTTSTFSTTAVNELLLAFISTDNTSSPNTTVTKVAGGGLVWSLVKRTNVQLGTSEIWWAFSPSTLSSVTVSATLSQSVASSLTVLSFSGVDTSSSGLGAIGATGTGNASTGAPTATLVTTRAGSVVLGVGNDWDNAIARTPGSGQSIVHSYLAPVGDTYWVQMQNSAFPVSGTSVTINDTAPTGDRYNLSIVEVVPPSGTGGTTFTVSGAISPSASGSGASVVLSQNGVTIASTTADSTGSYSFANISNGTYTVTPSKAGFTFSPSSQTVTVNGSNMSANFTAAAVTISGAITPSANGSGTTVTLSQNSTTIGSTIADSNGNYTFSAVANGTYVVSPSKPGFAFSPSTQTVSVSGASVTASFTASAVTVSGTVTPASNGTGATITLSQNSTTVGSALVDSNGNYIISAVANGTYTVSPSKAGFVFSPVTQTVSVAGVSITVPAFTASPAPTYTVSGSITPSASGSGANVTLTQNGTTVATVSANTSGNYSFPNLANATYVVTPSKAGFAFSPTNQTVTVNGADVSLPVFTATATSWSISGTVSPSAAGSGVTLTLVQNSSTVATVTADASGNYNFANLADGTYTVTPTKSGYVFSPVNQVVTINGADLTGVNFTAQAAQPSVLAMDVNTSKDASTATSSLTSAAFSTAAGNELLLAFVATDDTGGTNTTVSGVTGGGLIWVLVKRTNAQQGTAEIWRAFAPAVLTNITVTATLSQSVQSSITVLSFTGVDTSGTNGSGAIGAVSGANASSGAPTASLLTTRNNSWVLGVGNDWDNAIARTPGSGQKLVHQDLSPSGDTYWVQMQSTTTPVSGTSVTINDTAPTSDRYNLSIAEVLPSLSGGGTITYGISGTVSPAASGSGATVSLSGGGSGSATADANGNYAFSGLANGSYTLTPTKNGFTFTPPNQTVTVNGANVTSINFTAQAVPSSGIQLVQANSNGNNSGTASMSVAFTASNTSGNFLIVAGSAARPATNLSISDSLGNSYSAAIGPVTDTTQNVTLYIWYVPVCKGGVNTVTIVPSGTAALEIHVSEWSGLATTGSLDVTAFATGSGTSVSSGSRTTSSNGELIFGYGWVFNTATAGTGFTPISLINGDLDEYQIQTFAGSAAATFTQTSGTWSALMATFKSQASVTGPNVSMTSPAPNATVTANSTVSASASDLSSSITGVQFLLDGSNLGSQVTAPPYSLTWDTTTATAGLHTLSATVFDSAGLSAKSAPILVTVDNSGNAAIVGSWSAPVTLPTVAVNLLLLKNNTLFFYEDGSSATVWDYVNNKFTSVPTSTDLFCSGGALMGDGRVLAVGGYGQSSSTIGIANAEIFDSSTNTWTAVPPMAFRRWYPTATTLWDGRILVTAGWQTTNHTNAGIPEIYDPVANTWTQLTNANNPFETYPFMFQLADGRIIHTGGTEVATDTDVLDINAQTWTVLDSRIVDGGSATMYSPGKILKSGSAADSQTTGPSSNTAFTLDTTQPSPAWQQVPSMAYPRSFLNLTTLPDGTVLATGGETDKNGGNISNAVYAAELWSPQTQTWTTMAAMHTPREYHSTALLLPDGRVLESGMGSDFGNVPDELSAEFYSPPYLFKGTRPTITQAPTQIHFATNFFVATPDATTITSAVLIRTGAVTHFFDQNARFVPVTFQQATGGLTLLSPADGFAAPPGYYMLFLVNGSGVPSVAPIMQLTQ
ncbi:MAG TPA: carboxypeptidase regulatory-like domain-containing protein [Candidatus Acidoferrum sp.]|nr:carboxypeptidase regulatory-like domain-containing protein [Candidatus Acidoferrum sp.]